VVVNRYLSQQGLEGVRLGLPVPLVVGGIVGATALALVAGTLPALRAARLPAREAVSGG
jgi:ABC-type lipoprotein release transport system permease subunit